MTNKRFRSILWLLAVMLFIATTGQAQVTTATVYGRVLDPTGAVVPNAEVIASNQATAAEFNTVSSAAGEFTIAFLPAGTYTITIASEGFKTYQETDLTLASGQRHNASFTLEIGVTTETVTITSSAPLMNTVNAEQDISLNTNQVAELPMINRDITGILTLGTGASLTDGGWTLSINGLAPRGFTMTVDAVDAVPDAEFAGLSLYQNFNFIKGISVEAVQEVETSKNIFSAEVGHTIAGNVNLISKSGTNQFHGSAFEMYQSGGLHANNFLVGTKAPLVYHQFGGSIGGPIKKDELFFFGVYEGYRFGRPRFRVKRGRAACGSGFSTRFRVRNRTWTCGPSLPWPMDRLSLKAQPGSRVSAGGPTSSPSRAASLAWSRQRSSAGRAMSRAVTIT